MIKLKFPSRLLRQLYRLGIVWTVRSGTNGNNLNRVFGKEECADSIALGYGPAFACSQKFLWGWFPVGNIQQRPVTQFDY